MTGNTDFIAMENGTNKTQTVNNGHEVVREHNEENLRTQKEGEQKKNESYVYQCHQRESNLQYHIDIQFIYCQFINTYP